MGCVGGFSTGGCSKDCDVRSDRKLVIILEGPSKDMAFPKMVLHLYAHMVLGCFGTPLMIIGKPRQALRAIFANKAGHNDLMRMSENMFG